MGLDGLFRHRGQDLTGILNGLDPDTWDPLVDAPDGRDAARARLGVELGLGAGPLLAVVSRAVPQKGLDLVADAVEAVWAHAPDARFVALTDGDPAVMDRLAARVRPDRFTLVRDFDPALARRIYAGADLLLVPSRFEPCGLTQLIAQRYGTLPVVRRTGGLADTVEDEVDGFSFDAPEPEALVAAIHRALDAWRDPDRLAELRATAASRDRSWAASARAYLDIYEELT